MQQSKKEGPNLLLATFLLFFPFFCPFDSRSFGRRGIWGHHYTRIRRHIDALTGHCIMDRITITGKGRKQGQRQAEIQEGKSSKKTQEKVACAKSSDNCKKGKEWEKRIRGGRGGALIRNFGGST